MVESQEKKGQEKGIKGGPISKDREGARIKCVKIKQKGTRKSMDGGETANNGNRGSEETKQGWMALYYPPGNYSMLLLS